MILQTAYAQMVFPPMTIDIIGNRLYSAYAELQSIAQTTERLSGDDWMTASRIAHAVSGVCSHLPATLSAGVDPGRPRTPTPCRGWGHRPLAELRGSTRVHAGGSAAQAVANGARVTMWAESAPGHLLDASSLTAPARSPGGCGDEAGT